jgi:hypothetical protein
MGTLVMRDNLLLTFCAVSRMLYYDTARFCWGNRIGRQSIPTSSGPVRAAYRLQTTDTVNYERTKM